MGDRGDIAGGCGGVMGAMAFMTLVLWAFFDYEPKVAVWTSIQLAFGLLAVGLALILFVGVPSDEGGS